MTILTKKFSFRFGPLGLLAIGLLLFVLVEASLFTAFSSARNEVRTARLEEMLNAPHKGFITLVVDKTETKWLKWHSEYDFQYRGIAFHARSKQLLNNGDMVLQCEAVSCVKVSEPPADKVEQNSSNAESSGFKVRHVLYPLLDGIEHLLSGFSKIKGI